MNNDRLRSSNSRNETSIARHRKVRSMFQGNSVAGNGLSPGGTAANASQHEGRSLPIEATRRVHPFLFPCARHRLPRHPSDHHPPLYLPSWSPSTLSELLEFLESGTIDNGSDHSFPVHSIRIIWHPADVRKARNREAAAERSEVMRESERRNSIDRNHCHCRDGIWRDGIVENETILRARKKNYIESRILQDLRCVK